MFWGIKVEIIQTMEVSAIDYKFFSSLLEDARGKAVYMVAPQLHLANNMSIAKQAFVEFIAASCDSDSHFIHKLNLLEEVADEEGFFKLEIVQVPDCEAAVLAARNHHILLIGVDLEVMDRFCVEGQRARDQPHVLTLQDTPDTNHPVLPPTVHPTSHQAYFVEFSSEIMQVTFQRLVLLILWRSLPFAGENILIVSSFQPLMICFPVLGSRSDKQTALGTEILMMGVSQTQRQMMIQPPEQVPKISSQPLIPAMALILVEWQVYIS